MSYIKEYTDSNGSYIIKLAYSNGRVQIINEEQDLYQAWLSAGNIPQEILYVEPASRPIPSIETQQNMLWSVCKAYQMERIDDGGLSTILLKAALEQTPKAIAIKEWVNNLWFTGYKVRKDAITLDTMVNLDFSSFGELPYGFYEALEESVL